MNANSAKTGLKGKEDNYKQALNSRVKTCLGSTGNLNTLTSPNKQHIAQKKNSQKILSPKLGEKKGTVVPSPKTVANSPSANLHQSLSQRFLPGKF